MVRGMRIGIDLGGTKIEAIVMGEGSAILYRERVATPRDYYAGTLEAIAGLVTRSRPPPASSRMPIRPR